MESLARMTMSRARVAMRELVFGGDPALRRLAMEMLGNYGDPATTPVLEQIARVDLSEETRRSSREAIRAIRVRAGAAPSGGK